MKIVADENIDQQIVDRLRHDGHDVLFVAELDPGINDETVLLHSWHASAVLLTSDKDFGELMQTYQELKAAAERAQVPATALAREAIDLGLRQQMKKARHDAIVNYAQQMAGTEFDLDPALEAAGVEHLLTSGKAQK